MSSRIPSDPPEGAASEGTDQSRSADLGRDALSAASPAVRGRSRGRRGWAGAPHGSALAALLGWFSVGLGTMQVLAPRDVTRLIGLRPTRSRTLLMRAMGIRELATGVGVLRNRTSKEWLAARVAGDVLDLGTLGAALTVSERPRRTLAAAAAVLGVTLLDLLGAEQLAERRKMPTTRSADRRGTTVLRSVTIERPLEEVYAFWRDFTRFPQFMKHIESVEMLDAVRSRWRAAGPGGANAEWEAELFEERENELIRWRSVASSDIYTSGEVRLCAAADGATVVTVEMQYAPPGGALGSAVLKLFRREPGQQVGDDLRRLKQVLETGEVLLSDATAADRPRAARPPRQTLH